MKQSNARLLVIQAFTAAVYTALSLALPALSFGPLQVRFSEALVMLPVLSPASVWGVALGCFLTNLIGVFIGANALGLVDVAVGTAATLAAALLTRALGGVRLGRLPLLSVLPPVIINGAAIGLELSYAATGGFNAAAFWGSGSFVALGELIACGGLGLPMVYLLEKRGLDKKLL